MPNGLLCVALCLVPNRHPQCLLCNEVYSRNRLSNEQSHVEVSDLITKKHPKVVTPESQIILRLHFLFIIHITTWREVSCKYEMQKSDVQHVSHRCPSQGKLLTQSVGPPRCSAYVSYNNKWKIDCIYTALFVLPCTQWALQYQASHSAMHTHTHHQPNISSIFSLQSFRNLCRVYLKCSQTIINIYRLPRHPDKFFLKNSMNWPLSTSSTLLLQMVSVSTTVFGLLIEPIEPMGNVQYESGRNMY